MSRKKLRNPYKKYKIINKTGDEVYGSVFLFKD